MTFIKSYSMNKSHLFFKKLAYEKEIVVILVFVKFYLEKE